MERLWAPWRLKYVQATDNECDGCVLCLGAPDQDEKRKVLMRGKHCYAIMNIYPYNNGHIMIAPYRHTSDFSSMSDDELLEIMKMLALWKDVLQKAMKCHGFNIGLNLGRAAGAGIDEHLHFHIVPRWSGDVNFMPVIGNVKVIPESIEDCYNTLKACLKELMNGSNAEN